MRTETIQRSGPGDRTAEHGTDRGSLLGRIRAFRRGVAGTSSHLDAYEVLRDARTLIEQGWVQNRWFVRRSAPPSLREQIFSRTPDRLDDVAAACLVGAVVRAVRRQGSTDDLVAAGPALDLLWDAWQAARGLGGPGVSGRAAPREVRVARAGDLMRWNDQPGRTRGEVLNLLDLAAGRAIIVAVGGRA